VIFSLGILEKNNDEYILILVIYWKKTGLLHTKISNHKQWCQISWFGSRFHYLMIKMLYNRCTGIYKFGNNNYPRRKRRRSNLGHFSGKKSASYGLGNTVSAQEKNNVTAEKNKQWV